MNKRLIPPVRYDTGKRFEKKFDMPKKVDIIFCDSDQEQDQVDDMNFDLNDTVVERNGASAADVGDSNGRSNNVGLLPWVPRSVEFDRNRKSTLLN